MPGIASKKCSKGHPMQGANLYMRSNGKRQCKACQKIYQREYKRRMRNGRR